MRPVPLLDQNPMLENCMHRVLTIKQPWAHLIATGHKLIENRVWRTEYRGPLFIHAGARPDKTPLHEIERMVNYRLGIDIERLDYSAIIARVDLVDIVTRHGSPWFVGPFGFVLDNVTRIEPIPMAGQQGIFYRDLRRDQIKVIG